MSFEEGFGADSGLEGCWLDQVAVVNGGAISVLTMVVGGIYGSICGR